jgi:hypothetical protein
VRLSQSPTAEVPVRGSQYQPVKRRFAAIMKSVVRRLRRVSDLPQSPVDLKRPGCAHAHTVSCRLHSAPPAQSLFCRLRLPRESTGLPRPRPVAALRRHLVSLSRAQGLSHTRLAPLTAFQQLPKPWRRPYLAIPRNPTRPRRSAAPLGLRWHRAALAHTLHRSHRIRTGSTAAETNWEAHGQRSAQNLLPV